jgi:hypothetical protein
MDTQSEVTQLFEQIRAEYEAAQRGLTNSAITARDSFISARRENMAKLSIQFETLTDRNCMALIIDCSSESTSSHQNNAL